MKSTAGGYEPVGFGNIRSGGSWMWVSSVFCCCSDDGGGGGGATCGDDSVCGFGIGEEVVLCSVLDLFASCV